MKIAKANKNDMDAAARLVSILDNVDSGYYPPAATVEEGDGEPTFFDPEDREHLRVFYERVMACTEAAPGGLFRVVCGFHTLMHNDIVDPDADAIELHPRLVRGLDATTFGSLPPSLLDAAMRLDVRGFFAPSTCADAQTNKEMAAMRDAIARTTAAAIPEPGSAEDYAAAMAICDAALAEEPAQPALQKGGA